MSEPGKVTVDVLIVVSYDFDDPTKTCIYTNARTDNDALEDILSTWIQYQIGTGSDDSKPVEKNPYTIKIGLVIDEGDSFCTESDTGNKGLTAGIVMSVLRDLKTIPIKTLAERPQP